MKFNLMQELFDLLKKQSDKHEEEIAEMRKKLTECEDDRRVLREDMVRMNLMIEALGKQINKLAAHGN